MSSDRIRRERRVKPRRLYWRPDYEHLLEVLPVAVVRSDSDGCILFANALARSLFGEELIGKNAVDLYGPASSQSAMNPKLVKDALEKSNKGRLLNITVPLRLADGTLQDVLCCFGWDPDTDTVDGVIVQGVTQLNQSLGRIAESLAKRQRAEDALLVITSEARLLCRADRAYLKLHDPDRDILNFKALSSDDEHERFLEQSSPVDRGMTGYVFHKRTIYRSGDVSKEPSDKYHAGFDGTVSKVAVPLLYLEPDGEQKCYGVLSVDGKQKDQFGVDTEEILTILAKHASIALTQIKFVDEVQESYEDLLAEVRYARDAIGAGHLLHDGKNLVRGVIDELEAIQREFGDTPLYKRKSKELEQKLDGLRDLRDLMRELLERLRKPVLEKSVGARGGATDVRALARRVINIIPLGDAPIEVEMLPDIRLYPVYGEPTRLLLIFYNLITNAVTALKRSEKAGKITISVSDTPGDRTSRRVQVEDNGPGLRKPVLEFVRRGEAYSDAPGGTGLGLLAVRETIKDLNAVLSVDSKFGSYTRFTIDLPGPRREEEE